ncbi:hypothetical protein [uncultured Hyphomicrobium sp.]|uniref:hypothetical protein n=1 Tax=uncultured Hyphomicrobium sp. TaxID=194373 RepID=UPI0025E63E5E|nr:hypothetical protein [uncultured Hyphomicrobium sp.]
METKSAREFEGWTRKAVGEGDGAHEVYERAEGALTCTVDAELVDMVAAPNGLLASAWANVVRAAKEQPAPTVTIAAGVVGTGYSNTLHDRCVQRIVSETEGVFTEEARDILRIIASEMEDTGAPAHLRVAAELKGQA